MQTESVEISSLSCDPSNVRAHDSKNLEAIKASLQRFGQQKPIVIDERGIVIAGNGTLTAARALGWQSINIVKTELLGAEAMAFAIADNRTAELAAWDDQALVQQLSALHLEDEALLDAAGFTDAELEALVNETTGLKEGKTDADDVPYEMGESRVKPGEIWKLGDHRIMCGDSTDLEQVSELLENDKVEMVFTDPPYLMSFSGSVNPDGSKSQNAKYGAILNDKMSREDGDEFIHKIVQSIKKNCVGAFYICFYRLGLDYVFRALDKESVKHRALIIWEKGGSTLSNSDYMSRYEPIVYGWVDEHRFYGKPAFDIWNIKRNKVNDLHPTMKPVELCNTAISNSSLKGESVLDLFLGSGTTLIACEQLGRKCYGMELNPDYCEVVIKRWEEFTGMTAERVDGS